MTGDLSSQNNAHVGSDAAATETSSKTSSLLTVLRGQLIIDVGGLALVEEDIELLKHPRVSGVILFQRNFKTSDQLKDLCDSIHAVKSELLIVVDQEGGRVQRFSGKGFLELPSLKSLGQLALNESQTAQKKARNVGYNMAQSLLEIGIDLCLAPVLDCEPDLGTQPGDVLHERCFSNNPEEIIRLAAAYISGMADAGMPAIGKHFPGHGGIQGDTHQTSEGDPRSLEALMQRDILPYIALQSALSGIMLSHVCFPQIDHLPCSLSKTWVNILREQLKLSQVILTDCLSMKAVVNLYSDPIDRVKIAFESGIDLALLCNDRSAVKRVLSQLSTARNYDLQVKLEHWKASIGIS